MTPRASGWLREPVLHFLVLGAALFLLHRALTGGGFPASPTLGTCAGAR